MRKRSLAREVAAEIDDDRRLLADLGRRATCYWSRAKAVERAQAYHRRRIAGFAERGSITAAQREHLLALVEGMGTPKAET